MQESRLKWYGHVLRREEEYVGKRVMVINGGAGETKERKTDAEVGGWITPGTICRRENCQRRKRKTELIGGVS